MRGPAGPSAATHILLLLRALAAVVGVADANATTNDAAALEGAVVALIAHVYQRRGPHVAVADDALAVAALAQVAHRHTRLLAAQDEVDVWEGGRAYAQASL